MHNRSNSASYKGGVSQSQKWASNLYLRFQVTTTFDTLSSRGIVGPTRMETPSLHKKGTPGIIHVLHEGGLRAEGCGICAHSKTDENNVKL